MNRGLVIAAVAVTGCGAARATTTAEPEPSSPRSCPEATCPSCPEPSCPEPPPCPECPRSASEVQAALGESGFWCWRRTAGELVTEGECYRLEGACNEWRELAIKHGNAPTECTRRDRAVCFDLTDRRKQKIYYRCLFTPEECELQRNGMVKRYTEYDPGECRPTT